MHCAALSDLGRGLTIKKFSFADLRVIGPWRQGSLLLTDVAVFWLSPTTDPLLAHPACITSEIAAVTANHKKVKVWYFFMLNSFFKKSPPHFRYMADCIVS
ncbi:MAG: hypothetical protein CR991_00700 [Proteobacteria bacterium]|nr:MAG: hypothetical protein CR991_00700 [Pseudomonadota bacterium]